ncbi:hypothetical protein GCM10011507_11920 [Edaphobacter acidisoli]|uniref:Uncharacterized protein n=1 Tax=Edaphobacter acidisoli TaxID=2040573 RepID=A0A916W327_9BACT|nr:hypothetical protein GCM10011507_11920 [Edaphobacter acidisoli]
MASGSFGLDVGVIAEGVNDQGLKARSESYARGCDYSEEGMIRGQSEEVEWHKGEF